MAAARGLVQAILTMPRAWIALQLGVPIRLRSAVLCAPAKGTRAYAFSLLHVLTRAERHRMEQARARAADLETTVNVMQRRLRAAAYTPQGPDALVLFRNYDKHGVGGLSLQQFRAVVRKAAKTSEEDLDDHELVRLWKLLLANNGATAAATPDSGGECPKGRRPMLSRDAFVAFVHGERELDLLQCCLMPTATPQRCRPAGTPASTPSPAQDSLGPDFAGAQSAPTLIQLVCSPSPTAQPMYTVL